MDIVSLLEAIASSVGYPRIVAAAPGTRGGLGYDIDRALEVLEVVPRPGRTGARLMKERAASDRTTYHPKRTMHGASGGVHRPRDQYPERLREVR